MKTVWALGVKTDNIVFESYDDALRVFNSLPNTTGWNIHEIPVIPASKDVKVFDINDAERPTEDSGFALLGPI